jgi:hypothetical protein
MNGYECVKDCLTPEERRKVLSRFHSLLFWVGEFVPDLEELGGKDVPLRDMVFHFITETSPDEATIYQAKRLADLLESKAKALENDLALEKMERERAYKVMHEALGLLRAVDELRNIRPDQTFKAEALMTMVNDERRWLEFVKNVRPSKV